MNEAIYDSLTPDGCCSLRRTLPDGAYRRLAVRPGDFDQVDAFAPELLPIFHELWTDALIQAYRDSREAMASPPPEEPEEPIPPQAGTAPGITQAIADALAVALGADPPQNVSPPEEASPPEEVTA